jgi:hypothetical protein
VSNKLYTRWTAQVHACSAIKTLVTEILVFLNKLIADKSDRSAEAIGMLHQIDFNFIFNLCMYYKILNLFKGVSDYFQKVTSNLSSANILLKSAEDTFKTMRSSDDEFLLIYFEAIKICENNNIDIPSEPSKHRF